MNFPKVLHADHPMTDEQLEWIQNNPEIAGRNEGFISTVKIDGKEHFKDLCVAGEGIGLLLPCDWLEYNEKEQSVWLKGTKKGNAMISEKHANFIINLGEATSSDIIYLIKLIRHTISIKFNILLDLEIKLLVMIKVDGV